MVKGTCKDQGEGLAAANNFQTIVSKETRGTALQL
jgi:hypothetical protein